MNSGCHVAEWNCEDKGDKGAEKFSVVKFEWHIDTTTTMVTEHIWTERVYEFFFKEGQLHHRVNLRQMKVFFFP